MQNFRALTKIGVNNSRVPGLEAEKNGLRRHKDEAKYTTTILKTQGYRKKCLDPSFELRSLLSS